MAAHRQVGRQRYQPGAHGRGQRGQGRLAYEGEASLLERVAARHEPLDRALPLEDPPQPPRINLVDPEQPCQFGFPEERQASDPLERSGCAGARGAHNALQR